MKDKADISGHRITRRSVPTPIGEMIVESCSKGIHLIQPRIVVQDQLAEDASSKKMADRSQKWLEDYFHEDLGQDVADPKKYPPICWEGLGLTEFSSEILKASLTKVKHGETVSYSELAALAGKPGASRATGTALKNNPISILVPCHRIIRADGSSGNYAGGARNDVKTFLINFEKEKSSK